MFCLFLVVLSSSVSALLNESLQHCWDFDVNLTDKIGTNNFTGGIPIVNNITKIGVGAVQSGNSSDLQTIDIALISGNTNRTLSFWVYECQISAIDTELFGFGASSSNNNFEIWCNPTTSYARGTTHTTADVTSNYDISPQNWTHVILDYNGTQLRIWANGEIKNTATVSNLDTTATTFRINRPITNPSYNGDFYLDEVAVWNRTLTNSEVSELYNNYDGRTCDYLRGIGGLTLPDAPVIRLPSPANNAHNNSNVTLNVSHSTTNNDVGYYLYFGTSSTFKESDLYLKNVSRTGAEYRNFTTNISIDGTHYWKWKVINRTNHNFSTNTTVRTWILETVKPTITLGANGDNNFSTTNLRLCLDFLKNCL